MNRRDFFQKLPLLAVLLAEAKSLFANPLSYLLPNNNIITVYPPGNRYGIQIDALMRNGVPFVNAPVLADAFNYHTYLNSEKRKLVIYLPFKRRLVLAGDNPFVRIDDRTFQMALGTLWYRDEIWVPLPYLADLINKHSNFVWQYDRVQRVLRVDQRSSFNVSSGRVNTRKNGVIINLQTTRDFKNGEISIDMRNEWLHIDMYNGLGDVESLQNIALTNPVREIKVYQFKELLSVAFRLRKKPLSQEVYQDTATRDVVAVLRYKDEIDDAEVADNEEILAEEHDDNVQRKLEAERDKWRIDTIVIDPGHGGKDPGAIGVGKLKEKDVVLAVALKLGELIKRKMPGVRVIYTRKDDRFIELRRRTQIANENNAKLFLSIHANANKSRRAQGFETYILGVEKGEQARNVVERENSVIQFEDEGSQQHYKGINAILAGMAQSAFLKQSEALAARVQDQLASRLNSLNLKNRGVKQAPFWVMVGASMPSVLIETGFITNKYEARLLKTASFQQKLAEGIFNGLSEFKSDYESAI